MGDMACACVLLLVLALLLLLLLLLLLVEALLRILRYGKQPSQAVHTAKAGYYIARRIVVVVFEPLNSTAFVAAFGGQTLSTIT
jgi:hypothetical protein